MNIAKNMEAIFIVAIGLVSMTTMATAAAPVKLIDPPALHATAIDANVAVVTVTAKRLTAAEKAQLAD
jgi:hypothetical protein